MEIFGLAITFFSLVIAYQTRQNGKFMKEELKAIKTLLEKMDESNRIIWQKMDERTAKISEQIERIPEKTAILLK